LKKKEREEKKKILKNQLAMKCKMSRVLSLDAISTRLLSLCQVLSLHSTHFTLSGELILFESKRLSNRVEMAIGTAI